MLSTSEDKPTHGGGQTMTGLWLTCEDGGGKFRSERERPLPHYCRAHIEVRRKEGFGPIQMQRNPDRPLPQALRDNLDSLSCDPGV